MSSNSSPILRVENITKRFPGVVALSGINFELYEREILGLVGENGAGKSTLIKILTGVYKHDSGEIWFGGKKIDIGNPFIGKKLGISAVFQELSLIQQMTVAENLCINNEPTKFKCIINNKRMFQIAKKALGIVNLEGIDCKTRVDKLNIAQQQLIEIAKVCNFGGRVIIFDEATSSLNDHEKNKLFETIKYLKSREIAIIYISHRLEEIDEICDRVTVLKDGRLIDTLGIDEIKNRDHLVSLITGKKVEKRTIQTRKIFKNVSLHFKSVTNRIISDVSFVLNEGEILGIAGLMGSGRTMLAKVIIGGSPYDRGKVVCLGKPVGKLSVGNRIAYLPSDRKKEGLFGELSVKDNISMMSINLLSWFGFIKKKNEIELALRYSKILGIKAPSLYTKIKFLSGGNQQKILIARALAAEAKIFVLHEPTRGIDVGAKQDIHDIIIELAKNDKSVIMISSEIDELLDVCDRILVMRSGRIVGEVLREHASRNKILRMFFGEEDSVAPMTPISAENAAEC